MVVRHLIQIGNSLYKRSRVDNFLHKKTYLRELFKTFLHYLSLINLTCMLKYENIILK